MIAEVKPRWDELASRNDGESLNSSVLLSIKTDCGPFNRQPAEKAGK